MYIYIYYIYIYMSILYIPKEAPQDLYNDHYKKQMAYRYLYL